MKLTQENERPELKTRIKQLELKKILLTQFYFRHIKEI